MEGVSGGRDGDGCVGGGGGGGGGDGGGSGSVYLPYVCLCMFVC